MHAILSLAFAATLVAQQLPGTADLAKLRAEAMQKHRTLQFVTETTTQVKVEGQSSINTSIETSAAFQNPGKSRTENKGASVVTTISDGEFTWIYHAATKQYTRTPSALGPAAVLSGIGIPDLPDASNILNNAKVIRDETVDVDGIPHSSWVVQLPLAGSLFPLPQATSISDAVVTQWIDKELGVSLQSTVSMKVQVRGINGTVELKAIVKGLKVDEPLAESLFTFTPPPGATEVAKFALPGPVPAPTGAVRAGNGVTPPTILSRVQPQFSELARQAGIQGTVVLQAIIDRDGRATITNVVRALGYGLDENAIAALEQWQFRPGMKDGVPVSVSLNIEVNFNLGPPPNGAK